VGGNELIVAYINKQLVNHIVLKKVEINKRDGWGGEGCGVKYAGE
jgi:hypothetical protein